MQAFKKRLYFNFAYFGLWLGYFILARFIFLAYYSDRTEEISWGTLVKIPLHGLKLDLSFAAYLSALPFLLIAFSIWLPQLFAKKAIKTVTFPLLFVINFLMLFDLALYGPWGVRLDSTPLMYLNTPKEMFASVTTGQLLLGISIWLVLSLLSIYVFNKVINAQKFNWKKGKIWEFPLLLIITGSLVILMRGGLQTIPINQSNVYFSDKMFANHAAVNFAWNFFKSLGYKEYDQENPFAELPQEEADSLARQYFGLPLPNPADSAKSEVDILKTKKPNVILIMWESLTAKVVEPLGGKPDVTVNLNKLANEGVLFTNFYANGERSDKGLVAVMSGYLPQPHKSIIKSPNKTRSLPMLPKEMQALGYQTSFFHGGDLNFGNMNTYLRGGGVQHFVEGSDFSKSDWNSKWGAHDHVVFERLLKDTPNGSKGFFKTIFTLSSHEPFEFPGEPKFPETDEASKFMSALAYTDQSLGKFISEAKKRDWWENTLIVVMADHGHALPKHEGAFHGPKKFHIPMLWLGGALAVNDTTINTISSQADFAFTLLDLLGGDNSDFAWGNHILKPNQEPFVHYIFNKGFGVVGKENIVVHDYVSGKNIVAEGPKMSEWEKVGKAITQSAYQDFLERK